MLTSIRFRRREVGAVQLNRALRNASAYVWSVPLFAIATVSLGAESPQRVFGQHCASCHAAGVRSSATRDELRATIRDGRPSAGMPAFGRMLSDADIDSLAAWIRDGMPREEGRKLGTRIDAAMLDESSSTNYAVAVETVPGVRYVGNVDSDTMLCYGDIDLTGVRSIEFDYARGENGEPGGRIAMLVTSGSGFGARTNIGEKITRPTGGWETFVRERAGFERSVEGRHSLCFFGLEGGGIFNLRSFTLSDQPASHDGITRRFGFPATTLSALGHDFALEKVAEATSELWAMAFLPDGGIVATQKNGELLLFDGEQWRGPVRGTPKVWNRGQGGLLDVQVHPDYMRNRWIYLAYSDPDAAGNTMTAIVRGRIDDLTWVDAEPIFKAAPATYSGANSHFGSSLAIHGGYIYFSVGERLQPELAQDPSSPYGKIHRLHEDGRIPNDNPYMKQRNALASVWSLGHRNPQGLTVHPQTGALWSSEHGPAGGDEINVVRKGLNYGWPLVSFGKHYDGTLVSESPYRDGVEPPVHYWTPSIGVAQIEFYLGDRFPAWRNGMLVASLGRQELHLLRIEGEKVTSDATLFQGFGRIRDVVTGPDGYPYVVLNNPNGAIYRLVTASR